MIKNTNMNISILMDTNILLTTSMNIIIPKTTNMSTKKATVMITSTQTIMHMILKILVRWFQKKKSVATIMIVNQKRKNTET